MPKSRCEAAQFRWHLLHSAKDHPCGVGNSETSGRREKMRSIVIAAATVLAMFPVMANATVPQGVWTNPTRSVRVTFQNCGRAMCGKVVWASSQAESNVRANGGGPLLGDMLFRDFIEEEHGRWSGSVLVPAIGQTVSGTIAQIDANTLVGEGCLVAGFGCKRQTWERIR